MQQLHGLSLGQKHVVILEIQRFLIRKALSFRNPDGTRMENHGVLLIDGKPVFYLGTKVGIQYLRVFDKCLNGIPTAPAALFLQHIRQIKVVHGNHRLYPVLSARLNHLVIKGNAYLVHRPCAFRQYPGPCHGKTVCLKPHLPHKRNVLLPAVVVVAGHSKIRCARGMFTHINDGW